MPIHPVVRNGKPIGYQWGGHGAIYEFKKYGKRGAAMRAHQQGVAIKISQARRIRVRAHLRKGHIPVKSHDKNIVVGKKGVVLPGKYRKVIGKLSNPEYKTEHGGSIDFDLKKKVNKITIEKGNKEFIDLPDSEVSWHTHPAGKKYDEYPSDDDIAALMKSPTQQAQIIFKDGGKAVVVTKKDSLSKRFQSMPENKVVSEFKQATNKALAQAEAAAKGGKDFEMKYRENMKSTLAKKGVIITEHPNPTADIALPIKPVETK